MGDPAAGGQPGGDCLSTGGRGHRRLIGGPRPAGVRRSRHAVRLDTLGHFGNKSVARGRDRERPHAGGQDAVRARPMEGEDADGDEDPRDRRRGLHRLRPGPLLLRRATPSTSSTIFPFGQTSLAECCIDPNFQVTRGDCRDRDTVARLMRDADYIIPLAAIVGAPACKHDATAAISINREAIKLILSLRSPQQRIILPNTNSGYGIGDKQSLLHRGDARSARSASTARPRSRPNSPSSRPATAITFRLATVFGMSPRMRIDLLVNDFVYRAVNDRAVVVFEGHAKRNLHPHPRRLPRLPPRHRPVRGHEGPGLQRRAERRQPLEAGVVRPDPQATSPASSSSRPRSARTRTSAITSSRTRRSRRTGFRPSYSPSRRHPRADQGLHDLAERPVRQRLSGPRPVPGGERQGTGSGGRRSSDGRERLHGAQALHHQ